MTRWDSDPALRSTLSTARECFLAVSTRRGPHVTPHVFVSSGGRVWLTTSRNARKVKALRRDRRAGVLIEGGDHAVLLRGSVRILDAMDPRSALGSTLDVLRSGRAAARLTARSLHELLGYAQTGGDLPLDWLPFNRVLLALRPQAALVLDRRWRVTHTLGSWPSSDRAGERSTGPLGDSADHAEGRGRRGALAIQTPGGPIAAPAILNDARTALRAPAASVGYAQPGPGDHDDGLAFTAHHSEGIRPTDKHGFLLRGRGGIIDVDRDTARLNLQTESETRWSGFSSVTTKSAG